MILDVYREIQERAESSAEEICGFLLHDGTGGLDVYPCKNVAPDDRSRRFEVSANEQLSIMMSGKAKIFYHSHVVDDEQFSPQDIATADALAMPFLVYSCVTKRFNTYKPLLSIEPLSARRFIVVHHDCFSLMEDFYRLERSHKMPFYRRSPYDIHHGCPDAINYMLSAGFKRVEGEPIKNDALLITNTDSGAINHCGIYLGGGTFLHQLMGRASDESNYDVWRSRVVAIFRLP